MATIKEVLRKRKEDAKPKKYGPRPGRQWGRGQRRRFREENVLADHGDVYGTQYQFKNAAHRRRYFAGVEGLVRSGAEGDAFNYAVEDLQRLHLKAVSIYAGLNARVRRQWRSQIAREDRIYAAEHNSDDAPGSPPDDPSRPDREGEPVLGTGV